MSDLKIGDVTTILCTKSLEELEVVVTNVKAIDGFNCYYIRRKDNKPFQTKRVYKYNIWIKGEKVEVPI